MMFHILLKKQMTEIFRAYFYDAKKNKKRSVFSTVLFFGFFIILMVGIVGGMFAYLADSLCKPFAMVNMKWLYYWNDCNCTWHIRKCVLYLFRFVFVKG